MSEEFESGIFVKKEAWHKQGVVLEYYPDTIEAYRASGLNWNVTKRQLVLPTNGVYPETTADYYAVVRDKDNAQLGYVGSRYECFQNKEAFKWMEPLVDSGLWRIETAGSLKGGQVCWALMIQGDIEVIPNDVLKNYLLFTWSHNGLLPNVIAPTSIRVVCNNTLQEALGESDRAGKQCRVIHTENMRPKLDFIKRLFSESQDAFKSQIDAFRRMCDVRISDLMIEQLCEELYGIDDNAETGKRGVTMAENRVTCAKNLCLGGASGMKELGIKNTAYGVFNALSEFNEHYYVSGRVDSGMNILFGSGKKRNEKAFSAVMKMIA